MKSIEIYINGLGNNINILIDAINERIIINDRMKKITKEQINDLLRIIRKWESKDDNSLLDGEKFEIKINSIHESEVISGLTAHQTNYHLLKDWIDEFYE